MSTHYQMVRLIGPRVHKMYSPSVNKDWLPLFFCGGTQLCAQIFFSSVSRQYLVLFFLVETTMDDQSHDFMCKSIPAIVESASDSSDDSDDDDDEEQKDENTSAVSDDDIIPGPETDAGHKDGEKGRLLFCLGGEIS